MPDRVVATEEFGQLLDSEGVQYAQCGADGKYHGIPLNEAGPLLRTLFLEPELSGEQIAFVLGHGTLPGAS